LDSVESVFVSAAPQGAAPAAVSMAPPRPAFRLRARDRALLERWVRASTTSQRTAMRSAIVLLLGEGLSGREVARRMGVSRHTVDLWRVRYMSEGCEALRRDRPGRGRRRSIGIS
jgi:DNA-directed RNA polymerase specialized sigma24 family protein